MNFNNVLRMMLLVFSIYLIDTLEVFANDSRQKNVPCEQGWFLFGNKCYKIFGLKTGLDWTDSNDHCLQKGGQLASIHSNELQEYLSAFLLLNSKTNVWIGLSDLKHEAHFTWNDGTISDYTNWDADEPTSEYYLDDEEHCVELRVEHFTNKIGSWNDKSCSYWRSYICQVNKSDKLSPDPRFCSVEDGGGWQYLKSCYHIVPEEKSWEDAEKYCEEKFMGYLVTILDAKTEVFLNYILSNFDKSHWIGIKMRDQGIQKWASGWPVIYNNSYPHKEHHLNGTCGLKSKENYWTAAPCLQKNPFICERLKYTVPVLKKPPSENWKCPDLSEKWIDLDGEFCYLIETSRALKWFEANYECERLGGTLASISSEEETNILRHVVSDIQDNLYIGLHRRSKNRHVFEWADGSELSYLAWAERQPDGLQEECGELWTQYMQWNDKPCDIEQGFICKAKKVLSKQTEVIKSSSTDQVCKSIVAAKIIIGISFCALLVAILTGVGLYYSHKFWKRHRKNKRNDNLISFATSSRSQVFKPEELECKM